MNYPDLQNNKFYQDYINFLKKTKKVYYLDQFPWTEYQGCLQPAIHLPDEPPIFRSEYIKKLLKSSKMQFIRWSSNFTNNHTEWWWTVIREPIRLESLSSNTRSKIRRGLKKSDIKIITAGWLAKNGYHCFRSAFQRYRATKPLSKKAFQEDIKNKENCNCFEFWGIFIGKKLAGYAECLILGKMIFTSDFKYHPDYLKYYTSYSLTYAILKHYLNQQKYDLITNGTRSVAHDTQMQEFLIEKFNFKKQYCCLNVIYSPLFNILVKIVYPFRVIPHIIYKFIPTNLLLYKINAILTQEKIKQTCQKV